MFQSTALTSNTARGSSLNMHFDHWGLQTGISPSDINRDVLSWQRNFCDCLYFCKSNLEMWSWGHMTGDANLVARQGTGYQSTWSLSVTLLKSYRLAGNVTTPELTASQWRKTWVCSLPQVRAPNCSLPLPAERGTMELWTALMSHTLVGMGNIPSLVLLSTLAPSRTKCFPAEVTKVMNMGVNLLNSWCWWRILYCGGATWGRQMGIAVAARGWILQVLLLTKKSLWQWQKIQFSQAENLHHV